MFANTVVGIVDGLTSLRATAVANSLEQTINYPHCRLVRLISERSGDSYLAGLWYGHWAGGFCWRIYARVEPLVLANPGPNMQKMYGEKLSDLSVPAAYRAPSWSWASIDAGVHFM